MKKVAGAIGVAVLAAASAAVLMKGPAGTPGDGIKSDVRGNADASAAARGSLAPEAVLAIAPRRDAASGATPTRTMPPALQQFHLARSYGPIYARLNGYAFVGNCAANNLRDHMMVYNSTPNSSQVMAT